MSQVSADVFSFVIDYAEQVEKNKSLLTEFGEDDGLVMFCREFFNQFLAVEFAAQIDHFSSRSATEAWVKIKPKLKKDDPRAPIVAAFREFCQDYDTIIGEHYDKGGELTAFQKEFVPELLDSILKWAGNTDIGDVASIVDTELCAALEAAK